MKSYIMFKIANNRKRKEERKKGEWSMKLKVGVFFGGESVEHEISIISANQAMKALDQEKYEVVPVYLS